LPSLWEDVLQVELRTETGLSKIRSYIQLLVAVLIIASAFFGGYFLFQQTAGAAIRHEAAETRMQIVSAEAVTAELVATAELLQAEIAANQKLLEQTADKPELLRNLQMQMGDITRQHNSIVRALALEDEQAEINRVNALITDLQRQISELIP
jgi:hypothetical protein